MKRKYLLVFVLCVILMLLSCSCGLVGPQRYICEIEEVASVQIVNLDRYVEEEYRFEYTVLVQITDYEPFLARLNQLKHSVNWGDPYPLYPQHVVIMIDYRNGNFDLIHPDAQLFNKSGVYHSGYFFFDDEQFNALIADYMPN